MRDKIFIIAEVGQAHDGSLGILHSYIDALTGSGVNAIKFQIHIAQAESSEYEPFRVPFSYEDKTRFDYWQRMSFTFEQWYEVKLHCESAGLEFLASPFSLKAVELLEELEVVRYKIGSGELSNYLMLEKIARTGKPIILSSGMSSLVEIDKVVEFLGPFGNELTIMQCTTSYPTPAEQLGLNVISELQTRYPTLRIGLSEHTGEIYAGIAGAALGIEALEFHVVFDKRMFGPDAKSSLTIDEATHLVEAVRKVEKSLASPVNKSENAAFKDLKGIFEKSLAVNKSLGKGHRLIFEDLESKKPAGFGIPASEYQSVLGRNLNKDLRKYDFLTSDDLEDA